MADGNGAPPVPDLSELKPVDPETARLAMHALEEQNGERCHECGKRIGTGLHVFARTPVHREGRVNVVTHRLAFCCRDGCRPALAEALRDATFSRPVTFDWLDEPLDDLLYHELPVARRILADANREARRKVAGSR